MIVWRICKQKYASSAFTGIGANRTGGRFNHKGSGNVVYSASYSLALALIELWVHLPHPKKTPSDLCYVKADIPDSVSRRYLTVDELPINWDVWPHPVSTRELGTEWLQQTQHCLLMVPCAITRMDFNCLINPAHPHFQQISVGSPVTLDVDKRI